MLGKIYIAILFLTGLLLIWLAQRNRAPPEIPLLILLTTLAAVDFGIPVRFSYNDLLFLPIILVACRITQTGGKLTIVIGVVSFAILSMPFLAFTVISVVRALLFVMIVYVLIIRFAVETNSTAKTNPR